MSMANKAEFLQLISKAISVAEDIAHASEGTAEGWMAIDALSTADQLRRIADQVNTGAIPPSNGAGLGITRALSEWAPERLYNAGKEVEDYYRQHWM